MRALAFVFLFAACQTVEPKATGPTSDAAVAQEIGSLRNAVVATPKDTRGALLTYFSPGLSDKQRDELKRTAPHLQVVEGLRREEALERALEAHGVDAMYATPDFLRAARNLTWVQARSAGVDRYMDTRELVDNPAIVLTNMRGVHGPAIADHVFAMLLALTRDLPVHLAGRERGAWNRNGSGELHTIALADRTLLVVGLGGIGTEVARRAHGFGMRVLATRRSDDPAPAFVERLGKPEQLHEFLALSDVVVLCVPLTAETERMADTRFFAALKPDAYLVNIARGAVVDQDALVAALRSKRLAGACLDVTEPEPLPPEHPLWSFPNVVITPHVASDALLTTERADALLLENLRRFASGEPLLNVVDKNAGY